MGFIMEGLAAEGYDRSYSDRQLVGRIIRYFKPVRRAMLLVSLMILLNSLMDTALPILISRGIDHLASVVTLGRTGVIIAGILAAGALSWTFNFIRQTLTARAVGDVVLKLREDAFDAVMARDMSFYDEYPSGKIVSRVTSDTQDFSTVVTLVLNLVSQVLLVVLIGGVMLYINLRLALLGLVVAPVIVAVALAFRRIARRTTTESRRMLATVNATIQESIGGIRVAKAFRRERAVYDEFLGVNDTTYRVNLRQGYVFSGIFPILGTVAGLGTVIVVVFGGLAAMDAVVSPGEWYFFVQSIGLFWFPLTGIASFWSQFQNGLSASERVFALIDAEPRVTQIASEPVDSVAGHVQFVDLDFHYVSGEPVLTAFNLDIPAGQTVAMVGHTGAGKSSLGKLIARFYEYQGGSILIDGCDIRTLDLASYRRHLGVVPQSPFLFAGTVAENIRYGRPGARDGAVASVARRVGHGDWVAALPAGLDTEVGEMGHGLSMGQRQLVALARVLLQDPSLVILDEATASVDPLTEAQIQEGLDVVLADRTAVVIAHRLSTIRTADRIVVLRQGRIIEDGSHTALMAAGGHYAELYNAYFRHQSPDYRPGEGFVAVRRAGP
ncbi:MAG: ABC transporter ATP-binding protein [Anaerolineae bacterium]